MAASKAHGRSFQTHKYTDKYKFYGKFANFDFVFFSFSICHFHHNIFPQGNELHGTWNVILYQWYNKFIMSWTSSPLKHTCSWHDKLIILWILNRQAKISLCISTSEWSKFFKAKYYISLTVDFPKPTTFMRILMLYTFFAFCF